MLAKPTYYCSFSKTKLYWTPDKPIKAMDRIRNMRSFSWDLDEGLDFIW